MANLSPPYPVTGDVLPPEPAPPSSPAAGKSAKRDRGSDYAGLSRLVRDAELLKRRPGYYAATFALVLGLYGGGWTAFFMLGESWYQLIVAVVLGVAFTQVGFLGHDVGHRQVFRSRRVSDTTGLLLANLGVGFSYGWWVGKHTRHHANPNHVEHDPDITGEGDGGTLAWTKDQTESRTALGRVLARCQGWLFFPMLFFTGAVLFLESVRSLRSNAVKNQPAEVILLAVHLIGYPVLLLSVLSPVQALVFFAVQKGLFGFYMGCSFAPNHKGMKLVDEKVDFLRRQVLTARNVRGSPFVDVALGGLNYQIEHHLFPSMPRPNLRRAQPIVRAYCAELDVTYYESSLIRSYREAVSYLHETGRIMPTLE